MQRLTEPEDGPSDATVGLRTGRSCCRWRDAIDSPQCIQWEVDPPRRTNCEDADSAW